MPTFGHKILKVMFILRIWKQLYTKATFSNMVWCECQIQLYNCQIRETPTEKLEVVVDCKTSMQLEAAKDALPS